MRNTKLMLLAGVIVIALATIIVFIIIRNRSGTSSGSSEINKPVDTKLDENPEEIESMVQITQAQITPNAFTTDEGNGVEKVHLVIMPFFTVGYYEMISEFELRNFSVSSKIGTPTLIAPPETTKNDCQSYIMTSCYDDLVSADIVGVGNQISYKVVGSVEKYNQVLNSSTGSPEFRIILKDLGDIYPDAILDRDGIYEGARILEYLGTDAESLDISLQFDLYIKFDDGTEYQKRFNGELEGSKIIDEMFYTVDLSY